MVASSDDDSDDEYVPSSCAQTSRVAPGGPPPPRVSGPAFSPRPMNVSPIVPFNTSPSPPTVRDHPASLNSPGGLGRDEMESEENLSTVTVDDDIDSLHLVLTPTQDIQGQSGISSPPFLPLTPIQPLQGGGIHVEDEPPVLQGGDDLDQPGAAPVFQNPPVQPGGAVSTPRQRALQAASRQGAGVAIIHPVPVLSPPPPPVVAPPSQNTQNPPTLLSRSATPIST